MSDRRDTPSRPPDPVGTRPRVDPNASIVPSPEPPAAADHEPALGGEPDRALAESAAVFPAVALEPAGGAEVLPPPPSDPAAGIAPGDAPHAPRFQFLLGALLAIGIIAAVVAAGLITSGGGSTQTITITEGTWSAWQPGNGDPVAQIAQHVGREYRFPDGHQIVLATGGALGSGASLVVTQADGSYSLLGGPNLLYKLCGLASDCSIREGKASTARFLLMRREALELALYSFRYVQGVHNVVVVLPPKAGTQPIVLLFRHDALDTAVNRPLSATLSPRAPSVNQVDHARDSRAVEGLTPVLYTARVVQNSYLVLDPLSAAAKATRPRTIQLPSLGK